MGDDLELGITPERSRGYLLLVHYFVYVRKYTIDDAHREVDAIIKYVRENDDD